VCRARIVVEDVRAVARCLEEVAATPGVRVVRVKNMLRPGHDAGATGGFRVSRSGMHFSIYFSIYFSTFLSIYFS
jgi:hypothetical protein